MLTQAEKIRATNAFTESQSYPVLLVLEEESEYVIDPTQFRKLPTFSHYKKRFVKTHTLTLLRTIRLLSRNFKTVLPDPSFLNLIYLSKKRLILKIDKLLVLISLTKFNAPKLNVY